MSLRYVFTLCMVGLLGVSSFAAAGDARLVNAARNRDMASVRSLLKQRVDVNTPDVDGTTALHWAAHWDNLETVKLLIAAGANVKAANRYGVTPLHEASTVADVPMIEALLKAGASPNAVYGSGETSLMTAARTGNVEAVKLLLAHSADVNAAEEFRGATPLMFAAAENHADVAQILIEHGAKVNANSTKYDFVQPKVSGGGAFMERGEGGLTPLLFAARQGAIEVAQVLIAAGADVNLSEYDHDFTPMNTAVYNGHYDFAAMLVEKGASVNDGSLYLAIELRNMATYTNRPNPPEIDRTLSSLDIIKLLLARGADPNQVFAKKAPQIQTQGTVTVAAGSTPLHRAVKATDLTTIRLLMEHGADPAISLKDHTTSIMLAAGAGGTRSDEEEVVDKSARADPLDAIKIFLAAGADINAANDLGFTAMHYAAQGGRNRIIEFLAGKGAKLDLKNKAGKSPLDLALAPGPQVRYAATEANTAAVNASSQISTADLIRKLMAQ